jgi:hypothetical protein
MELLMVEEPLKTDKRPISVGSAERNTSTKYLPPGPPNIRTRARGPTPIAEEPEIKSVIEDESLKELEDIIKEAGK